MNFCNCKILHIFVETLDMEAIFKVNSESLTNDFLLKLKNMFGKNSLFEIKVVDSEDETDYLLSNESNRLFLLNSKTEAEKK